MLFINWWQPASTLISIITVLLYPVIQVQVQELFKFW